MPRQPPDAIVLQRLPTPLGDMVLAASATGICLLDFDEPMRLPDRLAKVQGLLQARISDGENAHTRQAQQELKQYFSGQRQVFSVALHLVGTPFQQQVWRYLCTIPFGQTVSYQAQARGIGRALACRAVAAANAANHIAIVIPCHRVIGKSGHLTGYGGGLPRKQWLLQHERCVLGRLVADPNIG